MTLCTMLRLFIFLWMMSEIRTFSITGTVSDDLSFFYKEFPTSASQSATIRCGISYVLTNSSDYVNFYLYTTKSHANLDAKCSSKYYGQVRNKAMHQVFNLKRKRHVCHEKGDRLVCDEIIKIQDYKPRNFGFSFQFLSGDKARKSLKSLIYNVTISAQTKDYLFTHA